MNETTDPIALAQLIQLEARGFKRADSPEEKTRRAGRLARYARTYHILTSDGDEPHGDYHG